MPDRPEPNGWELLEGLQRIESRLDAMAKGFVTAEVFAIFQTQNQKERDADRKDIEELRNQIADQEKEKARNRLSIALAVVAVVAAILTPFIQRAMGG